ncbi:MAG: NADH:flavin oxidoreductase [Deltaproteobacteria bacterium]|nr:NADH:flavin oxidoreductase [Deltaproteobacteria bacterium]MBW1846285.1 NADH:flavin oxidoreductase [Deltaproteobacteria bacterium]
MSILFDPVTICGLEIKNRFIRSATYFALSDPDGYISDAGIEVIKRLAENNIGLIISGYAYVLKSGQVFDDQNGIQDDDHINSYAKMTEAVHKADGRIVMQIVHGGSGSAAAAKMGNDYMAVSITDELSDYGIPASGKAREMEDADIKNIIEAFGKAAARVEKAGFDGVQIHGAHGYLVSQFLSPRSNQRHDRWGGSLENRMRFVIEVTRSIKSNVSSNFPVMIKLGCRDFLDDENGLTIKEGAIVAKTLENEGICLIEVSHGIIDKVQRKILLGITSQEKEATFLNDARVIRDSTGIPLSLVGGMRSLEIMEDIVQSGVSDCISICRPFIREPDLITRWKNGDRRRAECISCSGCFNPDKEGKFHIFCKHIKNGKAPSSKTDILK